MIITRLKTDGHDSNVPGKKVKNTPMCQFAYWKLPTAARAVERLIFSAKIIKKILSEQGSNSRNKQATPTIGDNNVVHKCFFQQTPTISHLVRDELIPK